jgi:integrase/recombinase XerD
MENDQIIKLWLESQRSEKTREAYAGDILKLCEFLKDKPFAEVELGDLQSYQSYLNKAQTKHSKKYAEKTKQRFMIAVKSLFSFACEEGFIGANPARRIQIPKCKDNRGARVLSREEIDKLIAAAPSRRDYLILKTLFFSGARVSELVGLKWQDVQSNDATGGQLALFGKGSENRTVGIPGGLYEELISYRAEVDGHAQDRVFTSQKDKGGMSRQQVFRIVKAVAKRVGVNWGTSPHWLRHSFATEGLKKKAPLRLIQRDLGHKSIETTQIYLDINPDEATSSYLVK